MVNTDGTDKSEFYARHQREDQVVNRHMFEVLVTAIYLRQPRYRCHFSGQSEPHESIAFCSICLSD